MAAYQYVYVMKDLTKAFAGGREVFKGITLSFLPGVKIGVLGVNGAGKSTLLKIMAGIETDYGGEAWAAEGVRIGYLEQEPKLDETKTFKARTASAPLTSRGIFTQRPESGLGRNATGCVWVVFLTRSNRPPRR